MISYSIAPSIFEPPDVLFTNNSKNINSDVKNIFDEQIINFYEKINKIEEIINNEEMIILIFNITKISLDDNYMKSAKCLSNLPLDRLKKKLDKLQSYYLPDPFSNNKTSVKDKYFTFEDWFKFERLKYENIIFQPALNKDNYNNKESIIKIGIINNYIYKNKNKHFLIDKQTITYKLEYKKIKYNIKNESINNELLSSEIQIIKISDISYNNIKKYSSVFEVYKKAKELFSDYIIFGNDVERGINTIQDDAGPPDRIFTYLQTLKEFTEYKRNIKTNIPDDYLLTALGCNCSYEKEKHMQDKEVINNRMYDNGNNQKILFELHLKPNTYNRYGTVRIHISWDDKQKKVIVGWIGKHLYLPPKNP
jgi:hypothetical protein